MEIKSGVEKALAPEHHNAALGVLVASGEDSEKCRLSGAVVAYHEQTLALFEGEVDVVEHRGQAAVVGEREVLDLNHVAIS